MGSRGWAFAIAGPACNPFMTGMANIGKVLRANAATGSANSPLP